MNLKKLHFLDISIFALALLFCAVAFFTDYYSSELLSVGSLTFFYFFLQVIVDRFSKCPSAGITCIALTDLSPEGEIEFAEEPTDAKAAGGVFIKFGQKCVITDFKRHIYERCLSCSAS